MEFRSEDVHVCVLGASSEAAQEILTPDALRLVGLLCSKFDGRRQALLEARRTKATAYDAGESPKFLKGHPASQDPTWRCAEVPSDIQDRRVEITGPVDRKMVINGLNSGAKVYMADFEDSTSPTWKNLMEGQLNLRDAVKGTISFTNAAGKVYSLKQETATLFVRPRGWHLDEAHILVNGRVASGSIVDFALFLFHNHSALLQKGTQPYFYLPKLESHEEAALWNDVLVTAQSFLGLPIGTCRATVLLETITAAYQMEEILYELRDHSLGLNCGRWDYLFSFIKKFKYHHVTPDRSLLTMTTPLMEAYVKRLIYICHKRGTFAMGGMSAAIPIKNDEAANMRAMANVEADKVREVSAGHDGTWVAHPALVRVAMDVFDKHMRTPNQIERQPGADGAYVSEKDLLRLPDVPKGSSITNKQLEHGIGIVLAYTEAWLRGVGCIPLHNAMEDAATAEISRAQIWQWRTLGVATEDDGQTVTANRITELIQRNAKSGGKWTLACQLVDNMLNKEHLDDFLTTVCYPHIVVIDGAASSSRL